MQLTEEIRACLDTIFAAITVGNVQRGDDIYEQVKQGYRMCMPVFKATFVENVFDDEYAFIYEIIRAKDIPVFNSQQVGSIVHANRDLILDSPYINMTRFSTGANGVALTDDEKLVLFTRLVEERIEQWSREIVELEEFTSYCNIYLQMWRDWYRTETIQACAMIMSEEGYENRLPGRRKKHMQGIADCETFYNERRRIERSMAESERVKFIDINEKWLREETDRRDEDVEALMPYGLQEIDDVVGPMRRTYVIGILGAPKGGKTRMAAAMVERLLEAGHNVAVWPLEGDVTEWNSMLQAAQIRSKTGIVISSGEILRRTYRPELEAAVLESRVNMAMGEGRGHLSYIETVAYVEDFLDVLKSHYETTNAFDVVVIDSLVNIQSRTGKTRAERVSEAYITFKAFLKNGLTKKVLGIVPAQMKQDVIDAMRKNADDTIDVTAGGESAETIRTPDLTIGLFSSKAERKAHVQKLYCVATRHSDAFDDFACRFNFACCYYESDASLSTGV